MLSGAPAAHRWLDRTAPGLAARLPRWARIGSAVRRRNRLRHRIVDGVVQRSRRDPDGVLSLPDSVVVTLEPADREIVDRGFVDDLNREWRALAAAEGWSGPATVAVEIVEGATGLLRRPRLALGYDEAPVAHRATADMRSDTATPLERGPFLVTPDNRWVSLPPRRSIVVGRGAVDVQVNAD